MKLIIILLIGLISCGPKVTEVYNVKVDTITEVSTTDSLIKKTSALIKSTENSEKKVKELKEVVQENKELKQDIIIVKKERDDLIEEVNKERKRNMFKRIVDAIKDTL